VCPIYTTEACRESVEEVFSCGIESPAWSGTNDIPPDVEFMGGEKRSGGGDGFGFQLTDLRIPSFSSMSFLDTKRTGNTNFVSMDLHI
jgi:hypothetical protein